MPYDPLKNPDPSEWLALDEAERLILVRHYHDETDVVLPNPQLHAAVHAGGREPDRSGR